MAVLIVDMHKFIMQYRSTLANNLASTHTILYILFLVSSYLLQIMAVFHTFV